MSLYIHEENQQILWSLLDKLPYLMKNSYHDDITKYKEAIFKETIELFYEENKTKQISLVELEELNKKTLISINEKLVQIFQVSCKPETNHVNSFSNIGSLTKTEDPTTKYIQYTDKPNIQSIFSETIEDEPISNMDELIELYKKQRNADEPISISINPN